MTGPWETYGEYLERTGQEDTEQLHSRFLAGDLDDQEDPPEEDDDEG